MDGAIIDGSSNISDTAFGSHGDMVISGKGIVKRFGRTIALNGLNINVPRGSVYALLGRNGVGKSTLIQLLMGMLEPTEGTVSVLGLDPIRDDVAVKQLLGYIPERMPMYEWMTVDELLSFVSGVYKNWSFIDEERLSQKFHLKRDQKVGALSRGSRALLSLVIAMAHQPELVLLDECTSGMDAIARREFERSVIDALSGSGRTVLFAGHQIDEMERISDWVGIISSGRMLLEMPLDQLKRTIVSVKLDTKPGLPAPFLGGKVLTTRTYGKDTYASVWLSEPLEEGQETVCKIPGILEVIPLSLEEIFVATMTWEDNKDGHAASG